MKPKTMKLRRGEVFVSDEVEYKVRVEELEYWYVPYPSVKEPGSRSYSKVSTAINKRVIEKVESTLFGEADSPPIRDTQGNVVSKRSRKVPIEETQVSKRSSKTKRSRRRKEDEAHHASVWHLPASLLRVRVFLSHGLIYPSVFDEIGIQPYGDMQDAFVDALQLFESPPLLTVDHHDLVILARPEELVMMANVPGRAFLTAPLPISRLKGIGVPVSDKEMTEYLGGWNYPDVPVNEKLFFSINEDAYTQYPMQTLPEIMPNSHSVGMVSHAVRKYNMILGMLAYCRNSSLYLSRTLQYVCSISHASSALSELLKDDGAVAHTGCDIPDILARLAGVEKPLNTASAAIYDFVSSATGVMEVAAARQIMRSVYEDAGQDEEMGRAFALLTKGDYRSAIRALQRRDFPFEARAIAAIMQYGDVSSNDYRNIKQRLHEVWISDNMLGEVLALLGARYGYTKLDARERELYSVHPSFASLIPKQPDIKYHLRNNFERRLIERVYQRCFLEQSVPEDFYESMGWKEDANVSFERGSGLQGDVIDESYVHEDMIVKRYSIRKGDELVDLLRRVHPKIIDETSETGSYLMTRLFFLADAYELSRTDAHMTLKYTISTERVVEMLQNNQLQHDPDIMQLTLQKDDKYRDN